jgi:chromosome segregation ATPase
MKIEDYQKTNRDWENKIQNIKLILLDLEDKNKSLKEENEKLREDNEGLQFKMRLAAEREKLQENSIKNLKEIQTDYENKETENKREFKNKEENLKKKFEKSLDVLNSKLKEQEKEYLDEVEKREQKLKEAMKNLEKGHEEFELMRQKQSQTENFFKLKEQEFLDTVSNKDRKLRELESSIKLISEEANCQILKLSESVQDFNDKIHYYKQREIELTNEFKNLKQSSSLQTNQMYFNPGKSYTERQRIMQEETAVEDIKSQMEVNDNLAKSKTIDKLRQRIKELEEENLLLTRELNLKSEEFETLNEELRRSYEIININEANTNNLIRLKEEEIFNLTNRINELDMIISKYGANLMNIKKAFDKACHENKIEIANKNSEIKHMRDKYEKKIKDVS